MIVGYGYILTIVPYFAHKKMDGFLMFFHVFSIFRQGQTSIVHSATPALGVARAAARAEPHGNAPRQWE
jgi:hypothetical protein